MLGLGSLLELLGAAVIVTVGALVSIDQVNEAAAPVLPAASVPLTWNVCEPCASALYACGLVQAANAAPSSAHWNVEGDSLLLKLKLALVVLLGFVGDAVIEVVGPTLSIVQLWVAGVGSRCPEASIAVTWKVCAPFASGPAYVCGLVHAVAAPPSSTHSNVPPAGFVDVKANDADVAVVRLAGALVIVVSGGVMLITHACAAGVESVLPTWSTAATVNVCDDSARPL
jgi:hypothetical protein